MPGWWFTIESTTTKHFIQQFKVAIEDALRAKPDTRAIMRARAVKQRFPVKQWVEDLEKLQSEALDTSHKQAAREKRPTLNTPSTPAILETPGVLSVLQSRLSKKPSLHPRSARSMRPALNKAPSQVGGLSSIAEGRLLAGPGPGLGSKLGPGGKRKRPPPPLLRKTTGAVPKVSDSTETLEHQSTSKNNSHRPSIVRMPTTPNLRSSEKLEQLPAKSLARPALGRAPSMPDVRPSDRKAIKMLGMQLPAGGLNAVTTARPSQPNHDAKSSNRPAHIREEIFIANEDTAKLLQASDSETSTSPSSVANSPVTPRSGKSTDATPASTPASTPPSASRRRFGLQAPPIAAAPNPKIAHTPKAVDMFPSLGGHYFPHGSVAVLSTSEVREEKPDNTLQNVTPFFSDPKKEYESKFQQQLKKLDGKNSENQLCIEEYLAKSEKSWFGKLRAAELNRGGEENQPAPETSTMVQEIRKKAKDDDGFGLGANYKPPSGLKRIMRIKIGDWPIYSFLLAFVSIPMLSLASCQADSIFTGPDHSC